MKSHTKEAYKYIRAGFDVAFDEQSRSYLKKHIDVGGIASLIEAEDELRGLDGDMCLEVYQIERLRFVSQPLTKFWR